MRNRILLLSLLLAFCALQVTPAAACPGGYRPCGSYCCR